MSSLSKTLWVLPAVVMLCASVVPANESVSITRYLISMPLAFTENQGQWDEQVLFRANAGGATMWFTKDGAVYQFTRRIPVGQDSHEPDNTMSVSGYKQPDLQTC